MNENVVTQKLIGDIIESCNEIESYLHHFGVNSNSIKSKKLESIKSKISNDIYHKIRYIFKIRNNVAHLNPYLYQDEYIKFCRLFSECKEYFTLKIEEKRELEKKQREKEKFPIKRINFIINRILTFFNKNSSTS